MKRKPSPALHDVFVEEYDESDAFRRRIRINAISMKSICAILKKTAKVIAMKGLHPLNEHQLERLSAYAPHRRFDSSRFCYHLDLASIVTSRKA